MCARDQAAVRLQIGLPVFNGANFLTEAVDSLLAQTFRDFELLISDNGSTDATPAIAAHYARRRSPRAVLPLRDQPGRGVELQQRRAPRRRRAVQVGRPRRLAPPDLPGPLHRRSSTDDPTSACASRRPCRSTPTGRPTGEIRHEDCDLAEDSPAARYARTLGMYPMHVLFGVARLDDAAPHPAVGHVRRAADRVLVSEIALAGKIAEIPEPLFVRRWHPDVSWVPGISDRQYSLWFDPRNGQRRLAVPQLERAPLVRPGDRPRASLGPVEATKAYGHWLRYAVWTRGWSKRRSPTSGSPTTQPRLEGSAGPRVTRHAVEEALETGRDYPPGQRPSTGRDSSGRDPSRFPRRIAPRSSRVSRTTRRSSARALI